MLEAASFFFLVLLTETLQLQLIFNQPKNFRAYSESRTLRNNLFQCMCARQRRWFMGIDWVLGVKITHV